ncbi:hypothetical protein EVAR_40003_1 [Eumeta japonica]|uniref:Uncharacterized protein n=1 Tax=Eumeta variegata TaxID=151549 RepID=A0A4C1ZRI8_EUMVA|nr:hypothetical protein EVAR_40003_1 [Eumeta japonica]
MNTSSPRHTLDQETAREPKDSQPTRPIYFMGPFGSEGSAARGQFIKVPRLVEFRRIWVRYRRPAVLHDAFVRFVALPVERVVSCSPTAGKTFHCLQYFLPPTVEQHKSVLELAIRVNVCSNTYGMKALSNPETVHGRINLAVGLAASPTPM